MPAAARLALPLLLASCATAPASREPAAISPERVDAAMAHWGHDEPASGAAAAPARALAAPLDTTVRIAPPAPALPRRSGRRIDVDLHRASLAAALQLLASEARLNLVLADGITGEVSLSLRQVDPLEALDAVVSSRQLVMERQGSIVVVRRR